MGKQRCITVGRHHLTASVAYVTTLTYASTNDQWVRLLARWSVCQKLNRVSSVQFSYVAPCICAPLDYIRQRNECSVHIKSLFKVVLSNFSLYIRDNGLAAH